MTDRQLDRDRDINFVCVRTCLDGYTCVSVHRRQSHLKVSFFRHHPTFAEMEAPR